MHRVLWIDDNLDHVPDARHLQNSATNVRVRFAHPTDLAGRASEWKVDDSTPDLFLIDYNLDSSAISSGRDPYPRRGLSVAAQIREQYDDRPVLGFSVDAGPSGFENLSPFAEWIFDRTISLSKLQSAKGGAIVLRESEWYSILRRCDFASSGIETFIAPLNLPEAAREKVEKILLADYLPIPWLFGGKNPVGFAKWLKLILFRRPGPLWPTDYAAGILGLSA